MRNIDHGYGFDDRDPQEKFDEFLEELHENYKEPTIKEVVDNLLADYAFLKRL